MAADDIGDGRPLRVCDLCGGVDDHPRHVIAGATRNVFPRVPDEVVEQVMVNAPAEHRGRLVRDLLDTASSDRHLDCCRAAGCPDGSCDVVTRGAEGLTGADLLDHLVVNAEDIQARADAERQRQLDDAIRTELLGEN
jgi:hypothetical protein